MEVWQVIIIPIISAILTLIPSMLVYSNGIKQQKLNSEIKLSTLGVKIDDLTKEIDDLKNRIYNIERGERYG